MQLSQPALLDPEAETAWTAYQAFIGRLVETQQVTREVGERLRSVVGRERWSQGYRRERARALTQPTRFAV